MSNSGPQPQPPPYAAGPPPQSGHGAEAGRKWFERKRVLLPLAAAVAFFFGVGAGGATAPDPTSSTRTDGDESTGAAQALDEAVAQGDALAVEVRELEAERATLRAKLRSQAKNMARLERQVQRARAAKPVEEQPAEPEEPAEAGSLTVDGYTFTDLQVSEDFSGAFEMRARVKNNGDDTTAVIWTASLFHEGSVVGTLQGSANEFGAGDTITVEFISTDEYTKHDRVEVQVDTEL